MVLLSRVLRLLGAGRKATAPETPPSPANAEAHAREGQQREVRALYESALQRLNEDDPAAARILLGRCVQLAHDFADAHFLLGQLHQRNGEAEDAVDCYVLAAHFRPDMHAAHFRLGLLALDGGRYAEAVGHLQRAVVVDGSDARTHAVLGAALLKLNRMAESVAELRCALDLDPNLAEAHNNLGYVLFRQYEQFAAGAQHIERALELAPHDEGVLCTWTMVLQQQGRFDELLGLADRLLAANPALHEVRVNRALVLLTRGEFARGWQDYEARKFLPPYGQTARRDPEWDGTALAGRKLLVYSEQGIGDEIMFASCLPDLMRDGVPCVVECSPKLERLFRASFPALEVVPREGQGIVAGGARSVTGAEVAIAIGSLPRLLRNSLSDFPAHSGYLAADAGRIAHWRARLDRLGEGFKVGIAWRGGLQTTRQSLRSIPLAQWLPVLRCDRAVFVSLQHNDVAAELADLEARHGVTVHHWQDAVEDLHEAAALISTLDVVITVQTAVAHLAGALGRTAWVLLSHVPEWRYMADGPRMPWYPSVQLHRQPAPGDWASVLAAVAHKLSRHTPNSAANIETG